MNLSGFPASAGSQLSAPSPGQGASGARPPGQKRRPGRPRRSEGPAVSREAIIHEALVSLTASGSSGFALREIARRLGVSLPTLQRHFPTKDDLWRACIDTIASDLPGGESEAGSVIPNFVRYQIDRMTKYPRATAAMWNDSEPGAAERLSYLIERLAPRFEVIEQSLASAVAVGSFRDVDPNVFMALMGLAIPSLVSSRHPLRRLFGIDLDDEVARARFADALSDLLLNGLLVRDEQAAVVHREAV